MSVCLTHSYTQKQTHPTHSLTLSPLSGRPCPLLVSVNHVKTQASAGSLAPLWPTYRTNRVLPQFFPEDHALLVHFVGLFHYTNKVTAKVIIPHWSLRSLLGQMLLRQLAHSKSHGCLVGGMAGGEGERGSKAPKKGMFRKKRSTDARICVSEGLE